MSASVLQHSQRGLTIPFPRQHGRHAIARQAAAWIVRAIQGIREGKVSGWSRDTAKEFLQGLQLALIQQTKPNHPAVKHRLVITETLFGAIYDLQGRGRE